MTFPTLPDQASLQLVPCDPPLTLDATASLADQFAKLFAQFAREGRVSTWAVEAQADGSLLAIAWVGDADLSGCSRDKIARLLLTHEERHGRHLLSAPPIVVATHAGVRCVDRRGLRELIATGAVDAESLIYDLRCATLGAWRAAGSVPLAQSPFAALVGASPTT